MSDLDNRAWKVYFYHMVIQSIREFNRAVPFVPYQIRMAGGEIYTVPHPDFVSVSPTGAYVIVIDRQDRPHHLNALLIERVSPRTRRPRNKGANRS